MSEDNFLKPKKKLIPMTRLRFKDVQIHAALTVLPQQNGIVDIGQEPNEIAQFCVQLDAKFAPFTQQQIKIACEGLAYSLIDKARAYGILRAGE